jgi:hypothetical protein
MGSHHSGFVSVDITNYFLRRLCRLWRLLYPLDSSTYDLIESPSGLGSGKWPGSAVNGNASIISKAHWFRKFDRA